MVDAHLSANRAALAEWVVAGSPISSPPPGITTTTTAGIPNCGKTCSDLWLSEHRPMPGQPNSQEMWRQLNREVSLARTRTMTNLVTKVAGRTIAAVGAAQVGWWIGTQARPLFYGIEVPGQPQNVNVTISSWTIVRKGEVLRAGMWGTPYEYAIEAPSDGLVANTSPSVVKGLMEQCSGWPSFPAVMASGNLPELSNGGAWLTAEYPNNVVCNAPPARDVPERIGVYFKPWQPSPPTETPEPGRIELNPKTQPEGPNPAGPDTAEEVGTKVVTEVTTHPGDYPHLRPWIDSVTNGTSPDPVTDPDADPNSDPTADPDPDPTPTPEPEPDPNRPPPTADSRCGPAIPAIDLSPLKVAIGDKFPFGVFGWMAATLGGWTGGNAFAPKFTFPMPGDMDDLKVNLAPFADPVMGVVRPVLLIVSILGLMWLFATSAMGIGAGGRD